MTSCRTFAKVNFLGSTKPIIILFNLLLKQTFVQTLIRHVVGD